ncbi:2-amino-4-hydroxy-6-hydroxymethyldihydropteridine diphosphokinase [Microbulbifer thermotolerans]|uniref:2-amino-4-hydroxy-6-hydroxymethyldihydropteridine diphosphokinase n=1 Tax=Microbulbifer thermotolerans TaxID=252514 RepID=A0AB35I225_MICTH|nr:2-amino-4-hydroxy-6-hydroxymethyldihydropteridine diphosphokinase [Microbulbifer thermotolerans]MCX2778361.1 2-amino-4-hydroxy-6-hydroxymethyldihydropteridine diphosphokinase [Microbulbifer thermotolerans]MCX2784517.1 2-amino-4-hydroxy-6-hydroxymethyldihydropteridine diphosphokinase [Microbulbifer thermotolerans]MCX2796393.1 2-amino-4-hydroxy-6-hydroxymethyldihydropteridine diphosphokinase [Microbulbifer thermotolerans]MCX2803201.1 2-amino-4-hydroxy-6-hydroxymethyldihydropteridine diphosphok
MVEVLLGLGSNIDRERNIRAGLKALAGEFGRLRVSRVFESVAVGFDGDNFYNLVVAIHTALPVGQLALRLRGIEDANGRLRAGPKFSARTLDIDILIYGDLTGTVDGVKLPRAEIEKNAFVLQPLAELAPDWVHPLTGKSFAQMWAEYDKTKQKLWPVAFDWP